MVCQFDKLFEHDVDEVKQRLTKVWHGSGISAIDDVMDEWQKRLWACVHVKGGHLSKSKRMS